MDARFGRELQNISLKGGFLQEITRTVAGNFGWSEVIAQEALVSEDVPDEIWSALLRGWSTDHTSEEWRSLLATVERIEPVYSSVLYELSLLLNRAVERKEDGLPIDLLDTALARAYAGWASCAAYEQPLPEQAENWVTVAINRTPGYLLDFYFEALRLLWLNRSQKKIRYHKKMVTISGT